MSNPAQCAQIKSEREMLNDFLISQKQLTSSYNSFAGECTSEQLRNTFLNILDEEHKIQADLFCDIQSRGWYQVEQADAQKIANDRQKFTGMT